MFAFLMMTVMTRIVLFILAHQLFWSLILATSLFGFSETTDLIGSTDQAGILVNAVTTNLDDQHLIDALKETAVSLLGLLRIMLRIHVHLA